MTINIDLPWPPTLNTYWRYVMIKGRPRVLISEDGRAYRTAVYGAWLQCPDRRAQPLDQFVCVNIAVHPPDRRKRDLDNLPKAIFDSLTHANVWTDDYLVDRYCVDRQAVKKQGAVLVTIDVIQ